MMQTLVFCLYIPFLLCFSNVCVFPPGLAVGLGIGALAEVAKKGMRQNTEGKTDILCLNSKMFDAYKPFLSRILNHAQCQLHCYSTLYYRFVQKKYFDKVIICNI